VGGTLLREEGQGEKGRRELGSLLEKKMRPILELFGKSNLATAESTRKDRNTQERKDSARLNGLRIMRMKDSKREFLKKGCWLRKRRRVQNGKRVGSDRRVHFSGWKSAG